MKGKASAGGALGRATSGPRILFAVTSSVSLGFLRGQARRLAGRGWRPALSSDPTLPGQLETFAREEGADAYPVPMRRDISPAADLRALWGLYRVMRQVRPDVTAVGTPKAGLVAGLAAAAARVPVRVYTLHGLRLETATGRQRQVLWLAEWLAMACAQRVVCVSPSLERRVHQLRLAPPHKTLVLGAGSAAGVSLPPRLPDAAELDRRRQALGLGSGPVIGFVGRFVRDKGMAELMAAFAAVREQFPQAQLLLIGDHEPGDPVPASVRRAIDSAPGVVRTGLVPDVAPYYPLMTALALPTYREGFPTVALEAASWGLPVVTTDATGAYDAVHLTENTSTGWRVPVGDVPALTAALLDVLSDPAEARRRGAAGRAWVAAQFDPDAVQGRWAELYAELWRIHTLAGRWPAKRWLDVTLAGAGLIAGAVPLLALAALVRSRLGSPVIFRQVRPGLGGQPFTLYKFRTMTDERGPDGELLPDHQRLTPFGRWLRSTSLDELPELWNVLRGDMSLVGPRPLLLRYTPYFTLQERQRLNVRPGLTGWAQIHGRNTASWDERLALDVWYVQHMSLALDLRILLETLRAVWQRSGVVADPESLMQNLDDERRDRPSGGRTSGGDWIPDGGWHGAGA